MGSVQQRMQGQGRQVLHAHQCSPPPMQPASQPSPAGSAPPCRPPSQSTLCNAAPQILALCDALDRVDANAVAACESGGEQLACKSWAARSLMSQQDGATAGRRKANTHAHVLMGACRAGICLLLSVAIHPRPPQTLLAFSSQTAPSGATSGARCAPAAACCWSCTGYLFATAAAPAGMLSASLRCGPCGMHCCHLRPCLLAPLPHFHATGGHSLLLLRPVRPLAARPV